MDTKHESSWKKTAITLLIFLVAQIIFYYFLGVIYS